MQNTCKTHNSYLFNPRASISTYMGVFSSLIILSISNSIQFGLPVAVLRLVRACELCFLPILVYTLFPAISTVFQSIPVVFELLITIFVTYLQSGSGTGSPPVAQQGISYRVRWQRKSVTVVLQELCLCRCILSSCVTIMISLNLYLLELSKYFIPSFTLFCVIFYK